MNYIIGMVGEPPRLILSASEEDAQRQLRVGEVLFESDAPLGRWTICSDGASLAPVSESLESQKLTRWLTARAYRDQRAAGGCMTPAGRVDSDPESQRKINGGSTAAIASKAAGAAFAVDWTMEDNSIVNFDADTMILVGLSVMQHVALCQQIGTGIRNRINACQSSVEVNEIDITQGYPDAAG